jgi:hypothetical protein
VSVEIDGVRYTWNQAICETDWWARDPGREPVRFLPAKGRVERCSFCGASTTAGIFVRVDPRVVPYPREERE